MDKNTKPENNEGMKRKKLGFNFQVDALKEVNKDCFKNVGDVITDGLSKVILEERVELVEKCLKALDGHDKAIEKIVKSPGQKATYELVDNVPTGKQINAACLDGNQVEQYKKIILKSNNIVAALEKVKAESNDGTWDALSKVLGKSA